MGTTNGRLLNMLRSGVIFQLVGLVGLGGIVIFVGTTVYRMWSRSWSNEEIAKAMDEGKVLVERIKAFVSERGRLPATLDELDPPPAPPSAGMRRWEYEGDGARYRLNLSASPSGYPSIQFESQSGEWSMDM